MVAVTELGSAYVELKTQTFVSALIDGKGSREASYRSRLCGSGAWKSRKEQAVEISFSSGR